MISSEFFADAKPDAIRTIVDDLDASRAQIVVTLRPLARILPSQWQQYIQSNMRASYDTWLDAMFNKEGSRLSPSFWQRHRHDRLVARWAEVVGPDRVTVVALDEHDHDFALRAFERLTGLRDGTLASTPDVTNRSLTMPEVESVRAFNLAFRQEGLERPLHSRVMNFGAARYMRQFEPPADAPRVETPQWALDRAGAIAREMVDAIAASGVRVIGDLESLAEVPASRLAGDTQPPVTVPPSVAATMAMGVLYSSGLARDGVGAEGREDELEPVVAGADPRRAAGAHPRSPRATCSGSWSGAAGPRSGARCRAGGGRSPPRSRPASRRAPRGCGARPRARRPLSYR